MPLVFGQIKYNLNELPEFFVAVLQVHAYSSYLPLSTSEKYFNRHSYP